MAVDLSFLPDQPQVRQRKPEGLDLSFLPDQPEPAGAQPRAAVPAPKLDLSFLPDQPPAPGPAADPRPSLVDRMAGGLFGAKEAAPALPVQNLPAFTPPAAPPPVSPGTSIYNESLDAFLKGDQEKAFALAAKARAVDPNLVEAQRMMERIKPVPHNVTKVSTDTYNESLNAYLANDKEKALNLAHKALIQDRRNTEALRMVERLTNVGGLSPETPVAEAPISEVPPDPNGNGWMRRALDTAIKYSPTQIPILPFRLATKGAEPLSVIAPPGAENVAKGVEKLVPEPFFKGMAVSGRQIPELGYGMTGLVGHTMEKVLGSGGVSTAVKDWGIKGYRDSAQKTGEISGDVGDVTAAWQKAKQGDFDGMANWLAYAMGYGLGQMAESAAVAAAGGLIGSVAAPGPGTVAGIGAGAVGKTAVIGGFRKLLENIVEKRAAKYLAEGVVKTEAKRLAVREIAIAVGTGTALTGFNLTQEAGSIYPAAVEQAALEGRKMNGMDLARIWGSSFGAAGVDSLGDLLGLGLITGKFRLPGLGGKVVRGLVSGGLGSVTEGVTEGVQTVLERWGARQKLLDEQGKRDIINSMAMGAVPGVVFGGVGGVLHGEPLSAPPPPDEIIKTSPPPAAPPTAPPPAAPPPAPGGGFISFAGSAPKPTEVPIAPVRMLRPNFPIPSRFRIPQADIRARAEMIHHDAMQEREAKLSPLEQFVIDNGGIAAYKMGANGKIEEAEEFKDVPVRLRAKKEVAKMKTNSADIIAQQAANANLLPPGASGDDLREAIKRFQKRGPVPRIQDFYQDARRELENEYEQYGPPSRRPERNFETPEPQPFESRGEYNAGQPEKPIEAAGSRDKLKVGPPRAVFAFWQDRAPYDTPVPMYNILGNHKQFGSTVGPSTLKSLNLEIPPTPKFDEWKAGGSKTSESGARYGDEAIKKLEPLRIRVTGSGTTALGKETPFRPSGSAEAESMPPSGSPMSASGFSALQNQDSMLPPKPGEVKESGAQGQPLFEKRGEYGITQAEVDQNFAKTMDDMAVGKRAPTFPIPLGMTPDPMRLLGADHVPLVVSAEVIVKARTKHGIGVEALKQLPARLRDPLMIFDSATQPNSLVALMDMTVGGKKVVAAVHLGKKAGRYDVNSIASVHGRDDTEVGLWIKKGLLRYWDRQKGTAWLQSARLQLPMEGVAPSAKRILEKTDIVNAPSGQKGPEGVAETQMGLFGGAEPGRAVTKKPKPVPEGQGTLFGGQAQPKFNVPKSAFTPEQIAQQTPAVQKLLATEEGKHQVPQDPLPRAIQESVIVKEMEEAGQMATHTMEIKAPEDVAAIFHHIKDNNVEKLYCLALDANNKIIASQMVGMGVLDSALANPRDFLKGAHAMGAKKVIPLHNHPSLDPTPSLQDRSLTRLLGEHAERVGMELPYHIVIDDDTFAYISRAGDVEIKPMVKTAPPSGFIPVKSFGQTFFGTGRTLVNTPDKAANLAYTLAGTKKAAVAIALDTKNKAVGIWHLGEKYPDNPKVLGRWLGEMLMRNNAAGILLVSERMADPGYISEISRSVGSWGASLLDMVGWDGQSQGEVRSARGMGRVGESSFGVSEGEAPYFPGYEPPTNPAEEGPKHRMEDTTEEGFYTDEPAPPADLGTGAFARFIGVGKNSNRFPPPEMKAALLNPESKFHDLGFWDEGTLSTLAPIRAVEIADGKRYGMMKENFLKPIQDSDKTFQWELKEELKGIDEVFKGMSKAEKQNVFDVIEQNGTSMNAKVDTAVAYLKDKYETLLDRLNAVRAKIGKDPIKKRTNYITHFQELSILQDIIRNFGFRVGNASVTDITDVPASMLAISDFTKANSPYFKFAKQRIGEMTERDAEKAYRIYIEPALRSIHMSRAIKNARDILEWKVVIASEYEGSDPTSVSAFAIRYPTAYRYFSRYLNRLTGKRDAWDKELPGLAFVAGFTNKLFSAGSIAGNVGTVFTQLASLRNTAAETGPWALKGQTLIMTPKWNRFYQQNSRIAMGRSYEPSYQNERYIGSKVVSGALDKISQAASVPVSMMDNLMVGGAFLSGYFQAKGAGYTEAESIRHGDDVAERTQASANLVDRPPANQGKIKTMMGQFQTFIFNEYSQWKYDFLKQAFKGEKTYQGYGQGLGGMKQGRSRGFERFMYYALGTLALGAIYEALGLPNPFKQEGATIPGGVDNSAASKVWQHVVNQIPYISSVRFGGSPAVKGVLQGMAYILGNEQQKKQALRKLASVGVRAFPMGGQISKTAGAWRLAANEKDTWKAFKLLAFGKYMAKQNAGKPDGKTRTVRTRTVSARGVRARTVRARVAR